MGDVITALAAHPHLFGAIFAFWVVVGFIAGIWKD